MFKTERYNDLPKHILDRIPKLTGQTVKFAGKGKYFDKNNNQWRFPHMAAIPKTDRIVDPKDNSVYTIANVHNVSSAGEEIMPLITFDGTNAGHIIIRPDENGRYSPSDILTYEYLMLCNYNGSNKFRDSSARVYFEEVNDAVVAEEKITAKVGIADVIKMVATATDDEVKLLGVHLGIEESGDQIQVLRMKLLEFSEKDPARMRSAYSMIGNLGEYVLATQKAIERKIITRDGRNNTFKWTESKQEFYSAQKGLSLSDSMTSLANWFKTTSEGGAVYTTLTKLME